MKIVEEKNTSGVPQHLKDNHYSGAQNLGHGQGYQYPHDYENNYIPQQYLPDELVGSKFYEPTTNGYEERIKDFLEQLD